MAKQGTLLVVDDNRNILTSLQYLLGEYFERVITIDSPVTIPTLLNRESIDVVLLDMNFSSGINSGNEGLYWLHEIKRLRPQTEVVLFTAYADINLAVTGIKEGAADFVVKPWENARLVQTLQEAYARVADARKGKKKTVSLSSTSDAGMYWGNSPAIRPLRMLVEKVSTTDANILITGENGTGKDLAARMLRFFSPRREQVFIPIDLGSIPEQLFESELFGYEKGAFTDARKAKPGRMETASGGTLFLDEIGNLSLPMQAKLLTAIEKQCITRLGAVSPIHIDVRLICATNANLHQLVAEGKFRQDLLYRINTVELHIPPLRERGEDILLLTMHFLSQYNRKYRKEIKGLTREAKNKLLKYEWPGNVRELQHTVERAVILSENGLLKPDDFLFPQGNTPRPQALAEELNLEKLEKNAIERALKISAGNMSKAAELLGITRFALYRKLEKWGL